MKKIILTDKTRKQIKAEFSKMKTQQDLLVLLNKTKYYNERGKWEQSLPSDFKQIELQSLNYYKNDKKTSRYIEFEIPKKSGKIRKISAPVEGLRIIQTCLATILTAFYPLEKYPWACGFLPGRSIVDGAKRHVGKRYVLNIDLKDFFDSIDFYRVKAILCCDPFCLKDDKSNTQSLPYTIASLCCLSKSVTRKTDNGEEVQYKKVLPQGAPTSPILTNLICRQLDRQLHGLAESVGAVYSRYADDITFSTNSESLMKEGSSFRRKITKIIEEQQHLSINKEKTRVQTQMYRQEVTGLVVNKKLNVTKRFVKRIRMWLYFWEKYPAKAAAIYRSDRIRYREGRFNERFTLPRVIEGKLNYMKMVVGEDDPTYKKLVSRFQKVNSKQTRPLYAEQVCHNLVPDKNESAKETQNSNQLLIDALQTLIDALQ